MHLRLRGAGAWVAGTMACAAIAVALVVAPTAGAAVSASHITTPVNSSYFMDGSGAGDTTAITVSGTTTGGTAGDAVDINCYYAGTYVTLASSVPVTADGSFSTTAPLHRADYDECVLRAVPAGTTPADLSPFAGPQIGVGWDNPYATNDYYLYAQQAKGAFDYYSAGSCGVDGGYLYDSSLNWTTTTFACNAYLWDSNGDHTRSQLQVDGGDAYVGYAAYDKNRSATGVPNVTYRYSLDKATGNLVIHETDPVVKCGDPQTCTSFVSAGVVDHRTITQNHDGAIAWVTDVFTSTDHKAHTLDLLWENDNKFHQNANSGDASQIAYEFPGQSSFSTHVSGDRVSLPSKSGGTILLKMNGAADGDTSTGQGAIVYDRPAKGAEFTYVNSNASTFELHQTGAVKAKGAATFRFAYVQAYKAADVASLAHLASATFKGCTVPDVAGKSESMAKKAITGAGCAVGKVSTAYSPSVPAHDVISSKPKAKTHLAYQAKVALVVSEGKKK